MKTNSNFLKTMRIALVVFALTFSSNMNAATPAFGGGFFNWLGHFFNPPKGHHGPKNPKGNHGPKNPKGDAVPLDGGLGILLVGAAAFGVKKLRGNKNEQA